ncbi:MAG: EAL domain-containing protein [Pseudomonadota bacterium]
MLAVIVGLLLVAQLVSLVAVLATTRSNAMAQALDDLELGRRIFLEIFDTRTAQLDDTVQVLARDFGFKSAVASRNEETLRLALVNQAARINAELMLFQGVDSRFVASDRGSVPDRADLDRLVSIGAASDSASHAVVALGGVPYQMVAEPVFAPGQVGWIWVGFELGDALASQMRALTAMDVSFVLTETGAVVGSSLPLAERADVAGIDLAQSLTSAVSAQVGQDRRLTRALPLAGDGSAQALLHVSLADALKSFNTLRWQLALVVIAALIVSLITATKLSVSITRPVAWLLNAARRIGAGDYEKPIEVTRDDELGQLARTFNDMQRGIAEREASIRHAASHDALTDLPSRAVVDDRLTQAIARAQRQGDACSVLMVDLNRFKEINDTLGHAIGDAVLVGLADRFRDVMRESDTVARLGGDEFLLILDQCDIEQARQFVHRIHPALVKPMSIDNVTINISVSMGLAAYPKDASGGQALLRRADIAMYSAKEQQVPLRVYEAGQDEAHLHKLGLISDLCEAVKNNGLTLHYQPKVSADSGEVTHVEALVRWTHPEHGVIFPDQFIGLAEESGNIGMLTEWVLNEAVRQMAVWQDRGIEMNVAVNLSALDLLDERLPERVQAILDEHGVAPAKLDLEITESAVMTDAVRANATLVALQEIGVVLSIDDFGTGHSSLAQLKRLPVQVLKIDKSFVMNMADSSDDEVIVRSTIELAHNMGLKVVAEGVDNARSRDLLAEFGCEYLQGYLYAKPQSAEEFEAWLQHYDKENVA